MPKTRATKEPTGEQLRIEMWWKRFDLLFKCLSTREAQILTWRYGIHDKRNRRLDEVDIATMLSFGGTEIKIGSILRTEKRAIRKLQSPNRVCIARRLGILGGYAQLTMPKGMAQLARLITARS